MDEKILEVLRKSKNSFTPADEIANKVGISRATVARHISSLRNEGYDIFSQPHLGHKLISVPDKLTAIELKWGLKTKVLGTRILAYDTVDSTNTIAHSLAEENHPEGTLVCAEAQRKGKGRQGRSWVSPKSKGTYFSLILRPRISLEMAPMITLLTAVCSCEAIRELSGLRALIRWPNDILVDNKKVCGILTEMSIQKNAVDFIILGIGINVNTSLSALPNASTSLREESNGHIRYSRIELIQKLLERLEREYEYFKNKGPAHIFTKWSNLSALSGRHVKIRLAHKIIEGVVQGIDEKGALIVRLDNGFKQHIRAADTIKIR